jgi:hypothetical protein
LTAYASLMANLAITLTSSTWQIFDKVLAAVFYRVVQFFGGFAILIFKNGNITGHAAI